MKNFTQGEKDGFVYLPKGVLKSRNISLKALGVYFMIASLPDDWNFSVRGLCALCSDGRDSVISAVRELEQAGFLKRINSYGEKGRFSKCEWNITDSPFTAKPFTDNPFTVNQPQINNKQINIKEPNNKQPNNSSYELYAAAQARQRIIDKWNNAGLKAIKGIKPGSSRCKMLGARLREYGEEQITEAVEKAKTSPFLNGRNTKGWVITFDWFLRPDNFIKVLEGNYDERKEPLPAQSPATVKTAPAVTQTNKPSYDIEAFKRQALEDDLVYVRRTV
ncbi:MAG: helix-turn-helix domain-containing protein [Clostridia bacterium]|nr:helix-turn-helix domain-containing protein [Clostridia bacterium]